jgi:hypothetical protein
VKIKGAMTGYDGWWFGAVAAASPRSVKVKGAMTGCVGWWFGAVAAASSRWRRVYPCGVVS